MRSEKIRRNNRLASIAILSSAVASVVGFVDSAQGTTLTWNPSSFDSASSSYTTTVTGLTSGENLYLGRAGANGSANWFSGGAPTAYVASTTDVVFTDNLNNTAPSAKGVIRVQDTALNPKSMTFSHVAGGTGTDYWFLAGGDFKDPTNANVSSNAVITSGPFSMTLDTGFVGTVHMRAAEVQGSAITSSLTTIKSGTLAYDSTTALPASANGKPNITIGNGTLLLNVQPGATGLSGALLVTGNATLASTVASGRLWTGTIVINSGAVLTLEAIGPAAGPLDLGVSSGNINQAGSTGTLRLADVGSRHHFRRIWKCKYQEC